MPVGFTNSLAQRLHETSSLRVQEAASGDRLARGLVLVAPGDHHLYLTDTGQVRLDQGPRRQYVRPAIDATMESAAQYYGSAVIGVILTGMGSDGTEGAEHIKAAGGQVIAEHESTTVVNGMPQRVIEAGWADRVVPLPKIAPTLMELIKNGHVGI
jgi:two-component system chemotaxis response regulator CheB